MSKAANTPKRLIANKARNGNFGGGLEICVESKAMISNRCEKDDSINIWQDRATPPNTPFSLDKNAPTIRSFACLDILKHYLF